jgi:metallo-beta-lactamase family protein
MTITVKFCGAAGTVTGSCYLVSHPGGRFLVDCGLFQGSKTLRELNYGPFPFDPASVDTVLVTHAHTDHSGLLPKLCNLGFDGRVLTTRGTRDLLSFMLPDSGHIQETEVERLNRRNAKRGQPKVTPIYTRDDAEAMIGRIEGVTYDHWIEVGNGVRARFCNAGHILGSASIELEVATGSREKRFLYLLFSGDVGPGGRALMPDPEAPENFDFLFVESTYGDRERQDPDPAERREILLGELKAGLGAGGNVVIPAFAVERTQELLYDLALLFNDKKLPKTQVFLDSPLAIKATQVFTEHLGDLGNAKGIKGNPFDHPNFHFTETVDESKRIARVTEGAIIIAASGMCDAGRIRHHLKNNLWSPKNTVLLTGYQAAGTLGSLLEQGIESVRIHGEEIAVNARIRSLDVYSGHGDRTNLLEWVKSRLPVRSGLFLTHGDESALIALGEGLAGLGCEEDRIFVPRLDEVFRLTPAGAKPQRGPAPRLEPANIRDLDWHNDYAAFLLAMRARLRQLPENGARMDLLNRLRQELERRPERGRKGRGRGGGKRH